MNRIFAQFKRHIVNRLLLAEVYFYIAIRRAFFIKKRVKLVAIAKNEGAYLTEWIHHHLYFKFDSIDVYINNTEDDTNLLISKLAKLKNVKFLDGDKYFHLGVDAPQIAIYKKAFLEARRRLYSHVVFLDVDEFWSSSDFHSSIKDSLSEIDADIVAYEWVNKLEDDQLFSLPFQVSMKGKRALQIKVAVSTNVFIRDMNPHNVTSGDYSYVLANGQTFDRTCSNHSKVDKSELSLPLKKYYILHRINRSQEEYIASLSRGRPLSLKKVTSCFKSNRSGFGVGLTNVDITIAPNKLSDYKNSLEEFISEYGLDTVINSCQRFIIDTFVNTLENIRHADEKEKYVLEKVLRGIDRKEVLDSYKVFKEGHEEN
ncbi:glycosyltransferase family 2 protein [Paraglaciecola chathamensis]|uniref:glycosyltransferase family 2 protein n=1 Tax=Paraglaciecola chathamensis TaxID=368405 RepID=UPI0026F62E78|nr:glycosyltransferase family 2 protein [Paraglaciecola chathamensis]MDO6560392.1 glycosyltransferase family 2 protein [Paraglaciecola chathamensis]